MREDLSVFTTRSLNANSSSGLARGVSKAGDISRDDMTAMFATNVTGLINMTQAILPVFLKRSDGGRGDIINIGSGAGREAYPGGGVYCATKATVRSFSDSLRKELIATRIRVIEIDPGQVETVGRSAPTTDYSADLSQEFSVVRYYRDKCKADAVYA